MDQINIENLSSLRNFADSWMNVASYKSDSFCPDIAIIIIFINSGSFNCSYITILATYPINMTTKLMIASSMNLLCIGSYRPTYDNMCKGKLGVLSLSKVSDNSRMAFSLSSF